MFKLKKVHTVCYYLLRTLTGKAQTVGIHSLEETQVGHTHLHVFVKNFCTNMQMSTHGQTSCYIDVSTQTLSDNNANAQEAQSHHCGFCVALWDNSREKEMIVTDQRCYC